MKNKTLLIATFMVLCFSQNVNGLPGDSIITPAIKKVFPLTDYQQDFEQMVNQLVKDHPQLYEFTSEISFKSLVDVQYKKITSSTTIGEFLWICLKVVSAVNCGHTGVWANEINHLPNSLIFPVNVRYVGHKLYVVDPRNNSDRLSVGDEILAINGVEVGLLKEELFKHLPSDGFNETSKHEKVNLLFRPYFAMYFNFTGSWTVTARRNGKTEEIKLDEVEVIELTKSFLDDCNTQLCFETDIESSTAIMTIRSFAFYRKKMPVFKSFIDSCFQQITEHKIENLIIDLRNNGGGDPFCGSYLAQYLAKKPFAYFHKDVKRYSALKKTLHPNPNGPQNKPFILTNGSCFSTTGHFLSIIKENKLGILVGDETGATYTCNDNGKIHNLKNTNVLIRIPRNTYYTTAGSLTNQHGIIPDHRVAPGIDDILNNTDAVLNYTLELIKKE